MSGTTVCGMHTTLVLDNGAGSIKAGFAGVDSSKL